MQLSQNVMKHYLIIISILLSNFSYSQFQIESNFNSVGTGRNQSLLVNYTVNRMQFGVGIKYNFNKLTNFPQNVFYKKTFYATTPLEHWGTEFNLKFRLFNRKNILVSHLFFNSQFTKSHTRFEGYFAIGQLVSNPTSESDYILVKHLDFIGPFLAFENNIGLAFEIFLTENIYLSQKFGLGLLLFKNLDENTTIVGDGGNWVFSEILSFGVGYKFNLKEKK